MIDADAVNLLAIVIVRQQLVAFKSFIEH